MKISPHTVKALEEKYIPRKYKNESYFLIPLQMESRYTFGQKKLGIKNFACNLGLETLTSQ